MRSLSTLLVLHALLSLAHDAILNTIVGSLLLAAFMAACYRFADWKSLARGWM